MTWNLKFVFGLKVAALLFKSVEEVTIVLNEEIYLLDEVVVSDTEPTALEIINKVEGNRNPFVAMDHLNDVLMKSHSLSIGNNQYELENYLYEEDRTIYVILATSEDFDPRHYSHKMYVEAGSFALVKVETLFDTFIGGDPNPILWHRLSKDSISYKVKKLKKTLQFEFNNGYYTPKYINWAMEGVVLKTETLKEFCDWGARFEMMFSNTQIGDIQRPSKKLLLKPRRGSDPKSTPYNGNFWDNYRLLKDFPITEQIVRDLGGKNSLERQFQNSASK